MSDSRAFIWAGKVFIVQPQLDLHFLFKTLATKQNLAKYTALNQTIHTYFSHTLEDAARYELSVNRTIAFGSDGGDCGAVAVLAQRLPKGTVCSADLSVIAQKEERQCQISCENSCEYLSVCSTSNVWRLNPVRSLSTVPASYNF